MNFVRVTIEKPEEVSDVSWQAARKEIEAIHGSREERTTNVGQEAGKMAISESES